ncbi:Arabinogalactan endo-1,4-beta-galactosidase, putative, partial [Ricinus communis]
MAAAAAHADPFVKGADVGWLAQMEASGYRFHNSQGQQEDCLRILKDYGINTIRLRTWVNPSDDPASGHNSKAETVAMAVRAQKLGMRIMIDFHYSDSWADPQQQRKPAAWVGHDFPQLLRDVYSYTHDVMSALKQAGVTPEWVQVGNETPTGMIYPEGHTDNWPQLAQLINQGHDAIKAVSPSSKVVLHLDRGNESQRFRTWFDNAPRPWRE